MNVHGVKIISTIAAKNGFTESNYDYIMIGILIFCLMLDAIVIYLIKRDKEKLGFTLLAVAFVLSIVNIILSLDTTKDEIVEAPMRYQVSIAADADLQELYEKYNIVSSDGVTTIIEKKL